jgi:hypothetical protein
MSDAETVVRTLLGEARLPASDEEIATLAAVYPDFKAGVEMLYAVAEARYESPGLHFEVSPVFGDWG